MNTEHLHVIAKAIQQEIQELGLVGELKQFGEHLKQLANQPQDQSHQTRFATASDHLREMLGKAPSNNFTPAGQQVLEEIGARPLLGDALYERIRRILEPNEVTLAIAVQQFMEILGEFNKLSQSINHILAAFAHFKIPSEDLEPGQCEFGILIPRGAVKNTLAGFRKELGDITYILDQFAEVAIGRVETLQIRTVSSSDFGIYLSIDPTVALLLATTLERLTKAYLNVVKVRQLNEQLEKQGVPEANRSGIKDHADKKMDDEINKIVKEQVTDSSINDAGRKHELEGFFNRALKKIAARIDHGYFIEVRAKPLEELAETEEGDADVEDRDQDFRKQIGSIIESTKGIKYMKLSGTPILSFPAPDNDAEPEDGDAKTKKESKKGKK